MTALSVDQVKQINAPNGKFKGYNVKARKSEQVKLESVDKLKHGQYILKGTSSSNGITVVRIVSGKKK